MRWSPKMFSSFRQVSPAACSFDICTCFPFHITIATWRFQKTFTGKPKVLMRYKITFSCLSIIWGHSEAMDVLLKKKIIFILLKLHGLLHINFFFLLITYHSFFAHRSHVMLRIKCFISLHFWSSSLFRRKFLYLWTQLIWHSDYDCSWKR